MSKSSFTAWKKELAVGDVVTIVNHLYPRLNRTVPVTKAQTNALATRYEHPEKGVIDSWTYYPAAAEVRMSDDGRTAMLLDEHGAPWLEITQ